MASPQVENGFTKIANEIIEALMRTNLSAYQSRVLWAIWRDTYGYQKKQDWISNSQLVEMTGLKKPHVSRTLSELLARNIVTRIGNKIAFNKDYQGWRELPKRVTVTNSGNKVTDWGYRSYQSGGTPKKKVFKEIYAPFFKSFWKNYPDRNGKKLEKEKTFELFCKLKPCEALLCIHAAKNYADSTMVREGYGIRDPKRFLISGRGKQKTEFWREWIEPETSTATQPSKQDMNPIEAFKKREGLS